ncbi:MAG: hypothetical protein JWQ10_673 [Herbaspirillum sp.]|nr:hypothetical protein [Herbaspirillum sp.]
MYVVFDVLNPPASINHILYGMLHLSIRHRSIQNNPAVLHFDANVADINKQILDHALANQLTNALIGTSIILRPSTVARDVGLYPAGLLVNVVAACELSGLAAEVLLRLLLGVSLLGESLRRLLKVSRLTDSLLAESLLAESLLRKRLGISKLGHDLLLKPRSQLGESLQRLLKVSQRTESLLTESLLTESLLTESLLGRRLVISKLGHHLLLKLRSRLGKSLQRLLRISRWTGSLLLTESLLGKRLGISKL